VGVILKHHVEEHPLIELGKLWVSPLFDCLLEVLEVEIVEPILRVREPPRRRLARRFAEMFLEPAGILLQQIFRDTRQENDEPATIVARERADGHHRQRFPTLDVSHHQPRFRPVSSAEWAAVSYDRERIAAHSMEGIRVRQFTGAN
jgi:hypothetical protein